MKYEGFIGSSYPSASIAVDGERSINLYPEVISAPGVSAKSTMVLRRKQGLGLVQTIGAGPIRGMFSVNGRAFVVSGQSFCELLSPSTAVQRISIGGTTSTPVQMVCNTTQILIHNPSGFSYVFNLATNAYTQLVGGTGGWPGNAAAVATLDTYFIVLPLGTNQFYISAPLDGTTWSAINFGSTQEPDNAVALAQCHLYLWIFGQKETIIFQDTGNASFPFQRVPGSQIEQGCAAVGSVAVTDNTIFWLGADERGAGVVYRANGFLPQRISTHAVEAAIQGYSTMSDAIAYTYQSNGHLFYSLHFPTAGTNWVYDVSGGMWHERAYWNAGTSSYSPPLERSHCYCFGLHLVGDYSSGNIYQMSDAFATDNGNPIRWLRTAPHISDEEDWLFYSYFQLDMQVGGGIPGGLEPQVTVMWSDDGGNTYGSPRALNCGVAGEYTIRVKANRCGRSRNRVFQVYGTDPVPVLALIAAYLGVTKGRRNP